MADVNLEILRNRAGVQIGWRVRWRENGKRPGRSFGLDEKPLAERFLEEKRAHQAAATKIKPAKPKTQRRRKGSATLSEFFVDSYSTKATMSRKTKAPLSGSARSSRETAWKLWIEPALGARPIKAITSADIEALYKQITHSGRDHEGSLLPGAHPAFTDGLATASKVRAALKDIFYYAKRDGIVAVDPVDGAYIELPEWYEKEERTPMDDASARAILETAQGETRTLLKTFITIGPRGGEVSAIDVGDFCEETGELAISKSLSRRAARHQKGSAAQIRRPKTPAGKRRIILPKALAQEIAELCRGRAKNEPLFRSPRGKRLNMYNFRKRVWRALLVEAGVDPGFKPHQLRHYAATRLISDGVEDQEVSRMLGHAHVGITLSLYRHARPERSRAVADYWDQSNDLP